MPKKIAVFCDGTWNSPKTDHPTHVENLADAIRVSENQLVKYFPSVGAGVKQSTVFGKFLDRFAGGTFGVGLTSNILDAYRYIAEEYEAGDKLYLFGFPRGAFTVRSLAGLIRKAGLPPVINDRILKKALRGFNSPVQFKQR